MLPDINDPKRVLMLGIRMAEVTAYTDNFCRSFADRHRIAVCTFFPKEVGFPDNVDMYPGDGTLRGFAFAMRQAIERHRPEVIHSHYPHTTFLLLACRTLLGLRGCPPIVQTVHSAFHNYSARNRALWRLIYGRIDKVVHCGRASMESFPLRIRRRAKGNPISIPNGVDLGYIDQHVTPQQAVGSVKKPLRVGFVGRLIDCKNVELMIHAAAQIKQTPIHFTIIGDGENLDSLMHLANQAALGERFDFIGRVAPAEVCKRLSNVDIVVHPSRVEGLPRSVLEAMACRRPVLLSDIAPHREIAEGAQIPLFGVDDPVGLAELLQAYSRMTTEELAAEGQRCRSHVETNFSSRGMQDRYSEVYKSMAEEQRSSSTNQAA